MEVAPSYCNEPLFSLICEAAFEWFLGKACRKFSALKKRLNLSIYVYIASNYELLIHTLPCTLLAQLFFELGTKNWNSPRSALVRTQSGHSWLKYTWMQVVLSTYFTNHCRLLRKSVVNRSCGTHITLRAPLSSPGELATWSGVCRALGSCLSVGPWCSGWRGAWQREHPRLLAGHLGGRGPYPVRKEVDHHKWVGHFSGFSVSSWRKALCFQFEIEKH